MDNYGLTISSRVTALCSEKNVSPNKFENESGAGRNFVSRLGKNAPSFDKVIMAAKYFGVSLDYLCGLSEIREPATAKDSGRVWANRIGKLDEQDVELVARVAEQLRDNPKAMRAALDLALEAVQSSARPQ